MNKILRKTIPALSGAAVLMLPLSVFAETVGTTSDPISTKSGKKVQSKEVSVKTDAIPSGRAVTVSDLTVPAERPTQQSYLTFEGRPVASVHIAGLTAVDDDVARTLIKTVPGGAVSFNQMQDDMQALYNLGYFRSVQPSLRFINEGAPDKDKKVEVTYTVTEFPVIRDINITGSTVINKFNLAQALQIANRVPNMVEILSRLRGVEEEYKKNGYVLARVGGVDITPDGVLQITVSEGKIEGYKFSGNKRTKDYVIEREMRQKPGEPFNAELAKRSVQRLYNLGLFEDANIKLNQGSSPDSVIVEVEVDEANTGVVGVGAGYSESDGVTGNVTYSERNLFGTGDSLSVKWEFGGKDNANYDISYTKPWLDKKETSMTINLYQGTHEYSEYDRAGVEIADYDKKRTGQEIIFSRAESEFVRNYITLKHRDDKYKEAEGGDNGRQYYERNYRGETYGKTVEERRRENFGETRSITLTRVYDNRDNVFDPHHGKRHSYSFEFAGFGGDFNFRKLSAEHRYYWELGKPKENRMNSVLALQLAAGIAWGDMPLSQRFAVGGANLRGYRDDQFKGNSMLRASLEYRVPLAKKVQAVAFIDSGYAWDKRDERRFDLSKIKTGYGVGLRFQSPIGPVRLDYGIGSERKRFHFAFGGSF